MLVQDRFGDTGRVGHVVHGRAVEALPGEDLEPDSEELFPASGSREASRHGYPMVTRAARAQRCGSHRPRAWSSFSAAFTAYPRTIAGASRSDPAIIEVTIAVTRAAVKPTRNATTNSATARPNST